MSRSATRRVSVRSCSVTLLELLAGSAPAGVVPADVLVLVDGGSLCERVSVPRRWSRERGCRAARGGDDVRPRGGLVLVVERALGCLCRLEAGLLELDRHVEQREDDFGADRRPELLEHRMAFAAVLD